ncbi:hypothetical protein ECG_09026 [Echinococcus granulosus]|uniref:Uncharacterized protein n=2 Tax=Echinococcus granulosus TaxID=6210 RepID=W6UBM0_ECHGR|nr:hypothetical protein EGR_09311 [Echinococcus granulosus]EUB55837.1 hypothetical protein EGR_09311 [Echinococcus granulosus]KAH9278224.1 hypothetical protein ECG_09026 [Echinococcus granulosus]
MEHARERLLAFQTWDSWISYLLSITAIGNSPREQKSPPSIPPPPFPDCRTSDSEKIAPHPPSKTKNNSAKRVKKLFERPVIKAGRSRAPSRGAKRTCSSSQTRSRKRRSEMLSAIYRITRDLEAESVSISGRNNCHASEADSDTDSTVFLRISELKSETNETLPRPHVSPPIPPHKLEKKHDSQLLSSDSKLTKGGTAHEDEEQKERENKQGELDKAGNSTIGWPRHKVEGENGKKKKEENRREKVEAKAWKKNEEEGGVRLDKNAKQYAISAQTTKPNTQNAEESVSREVQRYDERIQVARLGTEGYCIRGNESGRTSNGIAPQLIERFGQKESTERLQDPLEVPREILQTSRRSGECALSAEAFPHLVRRWAHHTSLELTSKVVDFVVDDCSGPCFRNGCPQESQNTLDFVEDEVFIQLSKIDYEPSETLSEKQSSQKEFLNIPELERCVAERSLSELSTQVHTRRSKKANTRRLQKRLKHTHVPQNTPECVQEQKNKRKMRHKFKRHLKTLEEVDSCLRAGEGTDEETVVDGMACRRRGKRSRSRRRRKECRSKERQQRCKDVKSRRIVSEFGDESEVVSDAHGKDVIVWKCKKSPESVKKHKRLAPAESKNPPMGIKKFVQQAAKPIKCENVIADEFKKVFPLPRHRHQKAKRSPPVHTKQCLNRNNNAVNGKGDVKAGLNRKAVTIRHTSPPVSARESGCRAPCSYEGTPPPRRSILASDSVGDALHFFSYPTPGTKFSEATGSLNSSYSCFEPPMPSPCVIRCHQTPKPVRSVPGECNPLKVKNNRPKSHKLKPGRLLRRISSFKAQLEGYNKKGQPYGVENLLSLLTKKYALDLREYVQYLQVLRDKNNANRSWHLSIGQNKWGQWTQKEASEFEEFVCFISIDTSDIDDVVLPFRVSITRHKLLAQAFNLYRQSLQKFEDTKRARTVGTLGTHKDDWMDAPFAPFLWLKMCQLPTDHPVRRLLRRSSGPQDRRILAIENEIEGRILLAEDKVIFVRGLPCFQVHILAPTTMAIRFALMQIEQRLPSLHAKLVITERLPMVHAKWGDRSVQAPTMGNFTTRFNCSPRLAPRITVVHAPLSATPEDRRDFASYCGNESDPELEQAQMGQKFADKLCTY